MDQSERSSSVDPWVTTLAVLRNLFNNIAQHLSLREVILLGQLHRQLRAHPSEHINLSFIELLATYFENVEGIRDRMRQWGCVISGSTALSFICRESSWSAGDLDFYCPISKGRAMADYLQQHQGYSLVTDTVWSQPPYSKVVHGISGVISLSKGKGDDRRKIDVIISKTSSALGPITFFHSTVAMNFLSADKLTMFYPAFTFQHLSVLQHGTNSIQRGWLEKYENRGYTIIHTTDELRHGMPCHAACPKTTRSTFDDLCLHLRFGPDYVEGPVYWEDVEWALVGCSLTKVNCWNTNCPQNDVLDIVPSIQQFFERSKHYFPLSTQAHEKYEPRSDYQLMLDLFAEDLSDDEPQQPRLHKAMNTVTGYQPDFDLLADDLALFTRLGSLVLESEAALVRGYRIVAMQRAFYESHQYSHSKMGFFRYALHFPREEQWQTAEFRYKHAQTLQKFEANQSKYHRMSTELFSLIASNFTALMNARSRDSHSSSFSANLPSIASIKEDLSLKMNKIQTLLIRYPPTQEHSVSQVQIVLKTVSQQLYEVVNLLNLAVDRQTALFRQLTDLATRSTLLQEVVDSKRLVQSLSKRASGSTSTHADVVAYTTQKSTQADLSDRFEQWNDSISRLSDSLFIDGPHL